VKIWNLGIIGAGVIADFHARAINDIPNAKLIGFCDTIAEKAEELAKQYSCRAYSDYEQMLSDDKIDIVTIATPSGVHLEPTVAAAKAGKHVLCEKPLEITLERIDAMINAHEQAGTSLGCIFQVRFTEAIESLRDAIDQGRFGTITYAGAYVPWWRTDEYYKDTWHGNWKLDGGGALMNQSIHMIDMMVNIMGLPECVHAFVNNIGHPGIEAEDTAVANLRFKNGTLGIIYGTTSSYPGQYKRFEITGNKGTAVFLEDNYTVWQFEDERPEDIKIMEKHVQVQSEGGKSDPKAISHDLHTKNIQAFIKSLDEKSKFRLDGYEGRKSVELILSIYESAKEGKIIKL
jgi:predicted dehydrogenase